MNYTDVIFECENSISPFIFTVQVKYYPDKLKRIGQILSDGCLVKNLHRKKRDQDFRTVIERKLNTSMKGFLLISI